MSCVRAYPLAQAGICAVSECVLALGGLVGAGLFVGSGTAIAVAGSWVLGSYLLTGLILLGLLGRLSQMKRAGADAVLLSDFVHIGLGPRWGFMAAGMYWWFWTLLLAVEALAAVNIVVPGAGYWTGITAGILLLAVASLGRKVSARFSDLEIAFALLKILAISGFILFFAIRILKLYPQMAPAGPVLHEQTFAGILTGLLPGIALAMFSLSGVELIHPVLHEHTGHSGELGRVSVLVALRVFGIYCICIALIILSVPRQQLRPGFSPFTTALETLGASQWARWLDLVVLLAVLSTINSVMAIASGLRWTSVTRKSSLLGSPRSRLPVIGCSVILAGTASIKPASAYAFLVGVASVLLVAVYLLFTLAARAMSLAEANKAASKVRTDIQVAGFIATCLLLAVLSMTWLPRLRAPLAAGLCIIAILSIIGYRRSPRPAVGA